MSLILCEYFKEIYFRHLFVAVYTACVFSNHLYFCGLKIFSFGRKNFRNTGLVRS